jgi:hypothetical protein
VPDAQLTILGNDLDSETAIAIFQQPQGRRRRKGEAKVKEPRRQEAPAADAGETAPPVGPWRN